MRPRYPEVHARAHELAGDILVDRLGSEGWIADCGAGDGKLALSLEARGFRVCSVDPSPLRGMVRAAWEALPLKAGGLAAVTACASLQYADEPALAVRSAALTLRPGGLLLALLSPVHETAEGARKGEATARARTGNERYHHFDRIEVERFFRKAGLSFELIPFDVGGSVGLKRRLKAMAGVEQARFPTLVGVKGP